MNTFELTLDLEKEQGLPQLVTLRQGDKSGTTLVATIYDHGVLVSGSYTARVSLRHPGTGATYYRETATYSNGVATVTVNEQYAATVAGVTTGYFELLQGSSVKASTADFIVRILPSAEDGAVPGSVYDSAIRDALDELDAATGRISQMVVDATAEYLAAHPEITTTVQDNSVTDAKLIQSGGVLDRVGRLWWRLENLLTATPAEAESVTVADAAKTPVAGLTVFGKSTQDGTPTPDAPVAIESVVAPNLLDPSVAFGGVSYYTVNADGSVTVSADDSRAWTSMPIVPLAAGTYTMIAEGNNGGYVRFNVVDGGTETAKEVAGNNPITFTLTSGGGVKVKVNRGTLPRTVRLSLCIGSTAYPYVPYGYAGLWARGKNLMPPTVYNLALIASDPSYIYGGSNYRGVWCVCEPNTTYTFTRDTVSGNRLSIATTTEAPAQNVNCTFVVPTETTPSRSKTFTTPADAKFVFVYLANDGSTITQDFALYLGSTATAYQPYTESVTAIPLDGHTLRSLPDGTRDELTVDQYGHVTLVQRVGVATISVVSWLSSSNAAFAQLPSVRSGFFTNAVMSDHFAAGTGNEMCRVSGGNVLFESNSFSDAATASAWFAANPTEVIYPLATPQTYDLGTIDPTALVGPDMTAQAVPTAPFALTYERDLNATLTRLEAAIADAATA